MSFESRVCISFSRHSKRTALIERIDKMARYKIAGSMGYAGTDWEEEVEADSLADAAEMAFDVAI